MAATSKPMWRAYCTPKWPRPPMPNTATRSPGFAGALRRALKVVSPAQQQRCRVDGRKIVRNGHQAARPGDQHFGVSAVAMNAGEFLIAAVHQLAAAAKFAIPAG